jgi:hypothetical protein
MAPPLETLQLIFLGLLNPTHPKFSQILIGAPEKFAFDPRLLRK